MSAYGDMLGVFPELNEQFALYERKKKSDGTWDFTYLYTGLGVHQDVGRRAELINGIMVQTHVFVLWLTTKPTVMQLATKLDDEWYVAVPAENWTKEGGFYRVEFHRIVGTTATTSTVKLTTGRF